MIHPVDDKNAPSDNLDIPDALPSANEGIPDAIPPANPPYQIPEAAKPDYPPAPPAAAAALVADGPGQAPLFSPFLAGEAGADEGHPLGHQGKGGVLGPLFQGA